MSEGWELGLFSLEKEKIKDWHDNSLQICTSTYEVAIKRAVINGSLCSLRVGQEIIDLICSKVDLS